jgi:hypothetical protein
MPIKFDDREITAGAGGESGGAVFSLPEPAGVDAEYTTDDGERVSVAKESRGVLVTGLVAGDPTSAWRKSLLAAQRGLDVFSARGLADLHLRDPQFDHMAIYGQAGGQVLRVVGVSTLDITLPPITAVVRDAAGNVRPQPAPVSVWHESMRYYRQAQLSEDVFDSFRNLWLAFENLLDSFEPQRPRERETRWLKRALGKLEEALGLEHQLPPGTRGSKVNAAYKYFYDEVRTHLFHAKASRRPLLPHEQTGTNLLAARHQQLTSLYLRLLEYVTGVRRASGALMKGGFDMMMEGLEVDPVIQVTDDEAPMDADSKRIDAAGGLLLEAPATREASLEASFLRVFLARWTKEEVALLKALRKSGFKADGTLYSGHTVEGLLQISGLQALEVQAGMRVRNASLPKYFPEM